VRRSSPEAGEQRKVDEGEQRREKRSGTVKGEDRFIAAPSGEAPRRETVDPTPGFEPNGS
jgi:hypothetical protein